MGKSEERVGVPKHYYWSRRASAATEYYRWYSSNIRRRSMAAYPSKDGLTPEQRRFKKVVTTLQLAKLVGVSVFVIILIHVLR